MIEALGLIFSGFLVGLVVMALVDARARDRINQERAWLKAIARGKGRAEALAILDGG